LTSRTRKRLCPAEGYRLGVHGLEKEGHNHA
jgi:hypothetical protein